MSAHEKLLPCPFCGGEPHLFEGYWVECTKCGCQTPETFEEVAISAWNRRTQPAAVPEPWGWLCNGKGYDWEERDKVVRNPEIIALFRERPDMWRIEPLYLGLPPAAVPDGWRPIETAPKDGTDVLLYGLCKPFVESDEFVGFYIAGFRYGEWISLHHDDQGQNMWIKPTHWRPLPPPPGESE